MHIKKLIPIGLFGLAVFPLSGMAQGTDAKLDVNASVADPIAMLTEDTPLFLSVTINGQSIGLVAEFLAHPAENRISIKREEFTEIGLQAPASLKQRIYLDAVPGLAYQYDPDDQTIAISVPQSGMRPAVQSAASRPEYLEAEKSTGVVLNYGLDANFGDGGPGRSFGFTGLNSSLEGWIFSPYGTISGSGMYRYDDAGGTGSDFVRFDTTYEVSNANKALTFSVGDITTSGPTWSRPIRMGGFQIRRDFGLRSDLVTEQLLSFSGAAAVPSTVDVFIENNRTYSGTVNSGPFRIEDLPIYSGSGDAVIVVRDELGRSKKQTVSFFAAQNLLKKGVADYSVEIGVAREEYGIESNEYGDDVAYAGSLRYGVLENLTIEAHFEGKSDLQMASFGFNMVPYALAEVSLTGGGSRYRGAQAGFANATMRTSIGNVDINVNSMRAQNGFADLAFATGVDFLGAGAIATSGSLLEFPTAQDVISIAVPVPFSERKVGLSMIHSKRANSDELLLSTSYGQSLRNGNGAISVTGSRNVRTNETSLSLSLSMSLGNRTYARSSVGRDYAGARTANIYLARPLGERVGDSGYGLQLESQDGRLLGNVRADYRTNVGKAGIELQTGSNTTYARGSFEGALVYTGGNLAAGNTINDSFALVDLGVPDVPVYLQNRRVTRTNRSGRALVPGLSSHRRNRVSVQVSDLPETATIGATAMEVVPARRSGTSVDFNGSVRPNVLAIVRYPDGDFLEPGTFGYLNKQKDETYVGYDGQAWLEDVKGRNTIRFDTARGPCTVEFNFESTIAAQDVIDPVICR